MKKPLRYATFSIIAIMLVAHSYVRASPASDTREPGNSNLTKNLAGSVPSFPGAEGFGANTIGGRGGVVYEVTNTNDSGAGSLRSCVEASGPRICVFRTGGLITLSQPLTISNPYITIAGQTAPGGGITIRLGSATDIFLIETSEVIIRYITLRPGPGGENHGAQLASSGVALNDIMIDHSSISWGVDSDIETWYRVVNSTVQWSIISEALNCSTHSKGCHSMGLMIGGYQKGENDTSKGSENITVHHNLMAHDGERTPLMQLCGIAQVINNLTYDPAWTFSHQQDNCTDKTANNTINWIGNYHKMGPDSTSTTDLKVLPADSGVYSHVAHVYVKDNIGPSRTSNTQPDSNWVDSGSQQFIVAAPAAAPTVVTTDALTAYDNVLNKAGNNAGLDCAGNWYSRRDSIDTRVVNDVRNGTGHIINDPSQVGGWITPAAGSPCTDSDHDGMPDQWELKYGLNPNDPSNASADADGDGYTNLEEYLNGTDPGRGTTATVTNTPPATATSPATNTPPVTATDTAPATNTPPTTGTSPATSTPPGTSTAPANITHIDVQVGGAGMGSYDVPEGASLRKSYSGLDNGPVIVTSTNRMPIVAAIRDLWSDSTHPTSSIQLMGLPASLLSDTYLFPAYNDVSLDDQIRFGNVGSSSTSVTVTIGGTVKGTYPLSPSQSLRVSYPGLNSGPVKVQSSGGVPIIASIRDSWSDGTEWTSYAQLMGLPSSLLSTSYYFPAYNNVSLNDQINFGNVGNANTTVRVTIGGVVRGTYPLLPNQSQRVSYAGLDSGPVIVQSSGNVKIVASIRDSWQTGSRWTSYVQLMGLPASQLSTTYHFPVYDNVSLDGQLRFGNVGTSATTVTVTIGGVVKGTYYLLPSQSVRVSYAGLNSGPVIVQSSGNVKIIASLRDSWWDGTKWTSYAQLMGLPNGQLSTSYYFPAYNNVSLGDEIRIGVP
jgi:hypothetical protein